MSKKKLLNTEARASLKEDFKILINDVPVYLFVQKGTNDQYTEVITSLMAELTELEPHIKLRSAGLGSPEAKRYGVERAPTLLIHPDKYNIRFTGAPLGEEGRTLIMTLLMVSTGQAALTEGSIKKLARLDAKRQVRVFVSPT